MKLTVEIELTKSEVLEAITSKIREDFRYRASHPLYLGQAIMIEGFDDDSFIVQWGEREKPIPAPAAPAVEPGEASEPIDVEVKQQEPAF